MAIPQQNTSSGQAQRQPFRFTFEKRSAVSAKIRHAEPQVKVVGLLKDLRIFNKWGVGKLIDQSSGKTVNVVGAALMDLQIGNHYQLLGKMVNHTTFGLQLDVSQAIPDMENSVPLSIWTAWTASCTSPT